MSGRALSRAIEREVRPAGDVERLLAKAAQQRATGRPHKADRQYRRILDADPAHPVAHYELGRLASQGGDASTALRHFASALKARTGEIAYWLALAQALLAADRLPDLRGILERLRAQDFAGLEYERAIATIATALFGRAERLHEQGELKRAEIALDLVIMLDAEHAGAVYLAGNIAAQGDDLDRAVELLEIALRLDASNAKCLADLGAIRAMRYDFSAASAFLERSAALDPESALTHTNLAGAYSKLGRHEDALRHIGVALAIDPTSVHAHGNHGGALLEAGRVDAAIAAFDRALALDPDTATLHSNRLFAKLNSQSVSPEAYLEDALAFSRRFADPIARHRPHANDRDPDRRLRIGFVSGDLKEHAVAGYLEPFLACFDTAAFETFAYATSHAADTATERLKALFGHWRAIEPLSDSEAARLIETDRIDILVDLSGHTASNRLLVFARKPAPIAVSWIGYPGTTGLSAIDYRFTDRITDPPGRADTLSSERLWRLPRGQTCYRPAPTAPEPAGAPPSEANGYFTFGNLNRIMKIGPRAGEAWRRILDAVPGSRLLLEVAGIEHPETRAIADAHLSGLGLPLDRLILEPRTAANRYVLHRRVDIALDPFPYNGGTTSLDTLYMGVPLVALEGETNAGRMGKVILSLVGLDELVGRTAEDYVRIAVDLATDPGALRAIRAGLRERVQASPYMDGPGFARDVGEAFREMWRQWVAAAEPVSPASRQTETA